jgi:peptide/nickel transport system permease protein
VAARLAGAATTRGSGDDGLEEIVRFVLRRLGFFVLTLWAAVTLNFFLPRLMPGNPAVAMMGRFRGPVTGSALKALEAAFGVETHQSLISQYFGYLGNIATGNFGTSLYFYPESVGRVVLDAIPWTLGLVGVTTILAFVLGTGTGIVAAWRRGGLMDSILPPVFVITSAIPYFWIGLMLILIFAVKLQWFPAAFGFDVTLTPGLTPSFIGNVLSHAILPGVALLVTTIGTWILTMRNTMVTTLAEDYVRMARAKGLPGRRIMFDYAARNAILPNLTGFAMSLGFVVGGAILVEYVFNYPGVGYMLLQAVNNEDYPLMQTLFLLITVTVLVAILIADLTTALFDPRTRTKG